MSVKQIYSNMNHLAFWLCLVISIILLIASFLVPPTGVIDGTVLAGIGELFGFATLATVIEAIKKGSDVSVSHGNTTVTVNNNDEK
jgi:formate hydrogenlyase subunit 4